MALKDCSSVHNSRENLLDDSSDDSYSDSEGVISLTTSSSSDEMDAGSYDVNNYQRAVPLDSQSIPSTSMNSLQGHVNATNNCEEMSRICLYQRENGEIPNNTHPSHSIRRFAVVKETWMPYSQEDVLLRSLQQLEAFNRLRTLPMIRFAMEYLNELRGFGFIGMSISMYQRRASAALARLIEASAPLAGYMPVRFVDRALCTGLDVMEILLPCLSIHPAEVFPDFSSNNAQDHLEFHSTN